MPQATIDRIRSWLLSISLAALAAVCGILWADMREQQRDTAEKLAVLNDTVVRLTVLVDERP